MDHLQLVCCPDKIQFFSFIRIVVDEKEKEGKTAALAAALAYQSGFCFSNRKVSLAVRKTSGTNCSRRVGQKLKKNSPGA